MIREKAMESSHGKMDVSTMVNGVMESSTEEAFLLKMKVKPKLESGKMAATLSGSKNETPQMHCKNTYFHL